MSKSRHKETLIKLSIIPASVINPLCAVLLFRMGDLWVNKRTCHSIHATMGDFGSYRRNKLDMPCLKRIKDVKTE